MIHRPFSCTRKSHLSMIDGGWHDTNITCCANWSFDAGVLLFCITGCGWTNPSCGPLGGCSGAMNRAVFWEGISAGCGCMEGAAGMLATGWECSMFMWDGIMGWLTTGGADWKADICQGVQKSLGQFLLYIHNNLLKRFWRAGYLLESNSKFTMCQEG